LTDLQKESPIYFETFGFLSVANFKNMCCFYVKILRTKSSSGIHANLRKSLDFPEQSYYHSWAQEVSNVYSNTSVARSSVNSLNSFHQIPGDHLMKMKYPADSEGLDGIIQEGSSKKRAKTILKGRKIGESYIQKGCQAGGSQTDL